MPFSAYFEKAGLMIYDVEEIETHGGSLRIYGAHADCKKLVSPAVSALLLKEEEAGLRHKSLYENFQAKVNKVKNGLLKFLIECNENGKKIIAYGAAAKGCTLLNFAGVKPDLLPLVLDAAPSKQGKFLPGCHIPVEHPQKLSAIKPDQVLILPWNIAPEITQQISFVKDWGGEFVTAIPTLRRV
jgi:hypothetical protein